MFGWFYKILEGLGLINQALDEANASVDKLAETKAKAKSLDDKVNKL